MNDLAIVIMYLFLACSAIATISAFFFAVDILFYCFCWAFCKVDSYFQDRYYQKLYKELKTLQEDFKNAA